MGSPEHVSTEASGAQTRRYLIKRPKALQFFHNGELKRATEGERQAGRFELFLDLLYVALVANLTEHLAEHPSGSNLVLYMLTFAPAWHAWSDLREIMNSYYNDDLLQRSLILWIMALLVAYGNNANEVTDDIGAMRTTVGVYITIRFTIVVTHWLYSFASFEHQTQARVFATLNFVGLFLWIPLFFESVSLHAKIAVAVIAILYEEAVWIFSFGPWIKKMLKLTYSTAVDIPHEIDRQAAFYIIVLGEFLYGIIVGSPAGVGLHLNLFRAVETLVIAFSLNWIYVNVDGSIEGTHPLRRSVYTAFTWFLIHLPLAASLLLGGHMCAVSVGEEEFETGARWLLCGGLAAGIFCLWIIGELHQSKDKAGTLMLPKHIRVLPRLFVAIILACIPLAEELDVTQLLSIPTGLLLFLVIFETFGGLERSAKPIESWKYTKPLNETVNPAEVAHDEEASKIDE